MAWTTQARERVPCQELQRSSASGAETPPQQAIGAVTSPLRNRPATTATRECGTRCRSHMVDR